MITKHQDALLTVVIWLIAILACLGAVSPVLWYRAERASVGMRLETAEQARVIQELTDLNTKLSAKNDEQRYQIQRANRILAVAYPESDRPFISED